MRNSKAGIAGIDNNSKDCQRLRLLKNILPIKIPPDTNIIVNHNPIFVEEIDPSVNPIKKKLRITRQTIILMPNKILYNLI